MIFLNNQTETCKQTKIAHLFFPHLFAKSGIPFFKNNFQEWNFDCLIMSKPTDPEEYKHIQGAKYYTVCNSKEERHFIKNTLKKYDYVFIHSLFLARSTKVFVGLFNPRLLKKIVWVTWGYDLYLSKDSGLKGQLSYWASLLTRFVFENKVSHFVGIHPVDLKSYNQIIGGCAALYCAPYRFNTNKEANQFLIDYKSFPISEKMSKGEPFTIQIGHRAVSDLNHIRLLDKLSVYKDENIRIFLPLSYGDFKYARKVEDYARSIFEGKVVVQSSMVPIDEYRRMLSSVDILAIDCKRQIALGNIHTMFYMQKKVFLPHDSLLSEYYKENGVLVYDIENLGKMSFKELTSDDDLSAERKYIESFESKSSIELWEQVFKSLR